MFAVLGEWLPFAALLLSTAVSANVGCQFSRGKFCSSNEINKRTEFASSGRTREMETGNRTSQSGRYVWIAVELPDLLQQTAREKFVLRYIDPIARAQQHMIHSSLCSVVELQLEFAVDFCSRNHRPGCSDSYARQPGDEPRCTCRPDCPFSDSIPGPHRNVIQQIGIGHQA